MESVIRQYVAAYNAMDVAAMLALLHDNVQFENVSSAHGLTVTNGKAEFDALARQSLRLFSRREQRIRSLTLGERTAAVEIEFEAELAQDTSNGLRAGETLRLRGATFFAFTNGQIIRISDYS